MLECSEQIDARRDYQVALDTVNFGGRFVLYSFELRNRQAEWRRFLKRSDGVISPKYNFMNCLLLLCNLYCSREGGAVRFDFSAIGSS
jgi:hypothetical protein